MYRDNDTYSLAFIHCIKSLSIVVKMVEPKTNKLGLDNGKKQKPKLKVALSKLLTISFSCMLKEKAQSGFEYSPDSFLQHELEASFMYEDTPTNTKLHKR